MDGFWNVCLTWNDGYWVDFFRKCQQQPIIMLKGLCLLQYAHFFIYMVVQNVVHEGDSV